MWSLLWFPPALYRSPILRTPFACHPRHSPDSPLSARSQPPHPDSFCFHAFMGDFMSSSVPERRNHPSRSTSLPGISDATISISPCTVSSRLAAAAGIYAASGVFAFCLLSTASHPRGRTLHYGVGFAIVAASGRLRRPILLCGLWSGGSASRGCSHHCRRLHHLPALR
jgi:hypothetical protein